MIGAAVLRALLTGRVARGALGIAGVLGVAELAVRAGLVDPALLPPPSVVVARASGLARSGEFLTDFGATLTAWLSALVLTIVIAVPVGMVLGAAAWVEGAVRPVLEFLRPIPSVALIPLALLILQDDLRMKVAVIVYASLWPVLINTIYGLRDVDPLAKETLRSFGFGPLAVLRRVCLPSAAPFIATGVRLAASIALIVAVGVELFAGSVNGIGVFIVQAESGGGHTDLMIAAAVWAGLFGLAVNALLRYAERRAFPWHQEPGGEGM